MFWVTRSGDVVESTDELQHSMRHGAPALHRPKVVPVKRVGSEAFLGTRRLDRLRPATAAEVRAAREKWSKPRQYRAEDARARRRRNSL